MQIPILLTNDDITIIKAIDAFIHQNERTPKKREVITRECLSRDFKGTRAERVFERLKLLGIIEHHLNGHCWLSPQGKLVMRLRYPASTIMDELQARIKALDEAEDHISVTILRERAHGFAHGLLLASAFTEELNQEVQDVIELAATRNLDPLDPDFIKKRQRIQSRWTELQKRLQHIDELLREIHPEARDYCSRRHHH